MCCWDASLMSSMWEYRTSSPDWYKQLKVFARENRKNATLAEALLWDSLREELETKVLRQHIVGDYIVDFCCHITNSS